MPRPMGSCLKRMGNNNGCKFNLVYKYKKSRMNCLFLIFDVYKVIFIKLKTQTYPKSAKNLNFVTKQLDATMYGDGGGKLPIRDMVDPIDITIERMRNKDPDQVTIPGRI